MNGDSRTGVLIVDDHPATRAGLALFLEAHPDFELAGQVASGEEALKFSERLLPDVILMDMKLPGMDGVETTAAIKKRHPQVQVVAISSSDERDLVNRAMAAGAVSYLLKTASAKDLISAIRAAGACRGVPPSAGSDTAA